MSDPRTPELSGSLVGASLAGRSLPGVDLRGRDLSGADLSGADLSGADLSDATLTGAKLAGAGLRGTQLVHADLSDAVLDDADVSGADLSGATLLRMSMDSVTAVDTWFADAEWRQCTARGGDWSGACFDGGSMTRVTLDGLTLHRASLRGLRLEDCDLVRCALVDAQASGMQLLDTSLEHLDLQRVDLQGASLRFADLRAPDLRGANLSSAVFEAVDFRAPQLDGVQATGARFERCAGLGRAQRKALQDAGGDLPASPLERIGASLARVPLRPALILLVLALVGGWLVSRPSAPEERRPPPRTTDDLPAEQLARYQALKLRYETEPSSRVDLLLEMGSILETNDMEAEAEVHLREAVELLEREEQEPPVEPLLILGEFLVEHEHFDEALSYSRELDQPGASAREVAVSRLVLAQTLIARGDKERASALSDELIAHVRANPAESPRYRLAAAAAVEVVDGPAAARPLLEGVPTSLPLEVQGELALERANLLSREGDLAAALEAYDTVLRSFAAMPLLRERAREERARLLKAGTDPDAEQLRLQELAGGDDPEVAGWSAVGLARLALRRGDTAAAIAGFRDALSRFGSVPEVRTRAALELSEVLASSGQPAESEAVLRAELGVSGDPEGTFALRSALAERRSQAGDLAGALSVARETVDWAPTHSLQLRARLQLAGLADDAGRYDEAIDLYKEVAMAGEDPGMTAAAWFGEATLMRRRGFPEAALPLMDGALANLPASHRLRGAIAVERAEVLAELGRSSPAEVERMLVDARAGELEQAQPVAYASLLALLGNELAGAERHEDALTVYQQVAASPGAGEDPTLRQEAMRGQVSALLALGRAEQAEALLDGASLDALSGGGAEQTCAVRLGLARGKAEVGNLEQSIAAFEALLGSCRSARFLIGALPDYTDLLLSADREDDARRLLVLMRDEPTVPPVGRQVAALELGKLGSPEDLDRAASGPDESLAALARVETARRLADAGSVEQARALLSKVAEGTWTEPVPRGLARLELGQLAKRAGDLSAARLWFVMVRDDGASEGWQKQLATAELEKLGDEGSL